MKGVSSSSLFQSNAKGKCRVDSVLLRGWPTGFVALFGEENENFLF